MGGDEECDGLISLKCQEESNVNLVVDDEIVRILGQEVPELLDVLTGNVPDFRRSLRSVAEQTLDRDFGANAVLEIISSFSIT